MTWLEKPQFALHHLPAAKGSYLLVLLLESDRSLYLGRFGSVLLHAGIYCYAGNAMGPGGLRARLKHHCRVPHRPHWHIDWLRPALEWVGIYYRTTDLPRECAWVQVLMDHPGANIPVPGFGASDCKMKCNAHLVYLASLDGWEQCRHALNEMVE